MHIHTPNGEGLHRIVIVGGGAGGLELATLLGDSLRKQPGIRSLVCLQNMDNHQWHQSVTGQTHPANHAG